jgi:tetratricopeptide (TPR) repeat protein
MSKLLRSACLLLLINLFLSGAKARAQRLPSAPSDSTDPIALVEHQDPQWPLVQAHLPDPATATAERLELAADVLRARRFPEEALKYYLYAVEHGGPEPRLFKKLGVTEMELRNTTAARIYFQRLLHLKKNDAEGWNNLGAVEYMEAHFGSAVSDYKHAIKLDKKAATFHSNLGIAYFEQKEFDNARRQFDISLRLDPEMSEHVGAAGVSARLLSPGDHARYCYEMARLYAARGDEANLLHYLTMSSEGGFDVLEAMAFDREMARYRKDPRVLLLVRNAAALRSERESVAEVKGELPRLPAAR